MKRSNTLNQKASPSSSGHLQVTFAGLWVRVIISRLNYLLAWCPWFVGVFFIVVNLNPHWARGTREKSSVCALEIADDLAFYCVICNSFLNLISPTSSTSHLHLRSISGAPGSRSVSMRALVRRQFRFLNESARAILTLERTFTGLEDFSGGKDSCGVTRLEDERLTWHITCRLWSV